jgi:thiosulfate/3-mercaptopyruvate sulfurtransferase
MIDPVVSPGWVIEHRDAVVLVDVRWYLDGRSGLAAYRAGHVPGAVYVDLDTSLAAPPSVSAGRHPLPDPDVFAAGLGGAGIGDDDVVVAYDDGGGMSAARLVWLLRITGHPAALLDGGLAAWPAPAVLGDEGRAPRRFRAIPWPDSRIVDADLVAATIKTGSAAVIDARAAERYRGDVEPVDQRGGHIPGAVNVPFKENLDPSSGRWLPPTELRDRFARAGANPIVYCGSGVSACHDLLALERAGLGLGRLYAGSWSQWCADPSRPAARGSGDDAQDPVVVEELGQTLDQPE